MKGKTTMEPQLLERYFLGSCSSTDAYKVEEWLASSEKSEEDSALLGAIFDRIDKSNDALADKAYEKCASTLNLDKAGKNRLPGGPLLPVITMLAIAASFVLGLFLHEEESSETPVEFTEIYAKRGSSERITLPDGSIIVLKSGSSLIYPSEFRGETRKVFLSGECYASIAKNPECPFIMSTGMMNVRVTGTEFNIKSFPEDSEAEVALVEGSVQLEGRSGSSTPLQSISLTPGNVVKVDRKNGETRISEFNINNYGAEDERGNAFVFLDRRFCDIASELSRRLDVNIVIYDKVLGDKRFYSSFVNGESLEEMLATFNADGSMIIREDAGTIRITKR